MPFPSPPYRKLSRNSPRLIESYCPGCGLLIAASPKMDILELMEMLHTCPVHYSYPQDRPTETTELPDLRKH